MNGRKIWNTWYKTRWLLESGVVNLRPLITAEMGLEQIEEAAGLLSYGKACKIVLRPNPEMVKPATHIRKTESGRSPC